MHTFCKHPWLYLEIVAEGYLCIETVLQLTRTADELHLDKVIHDPNTFLQAVQIPYSCEEKLPVSIWEPLWLFLLFWCIFLLTHRLRVGFPYLDFAVSSSSHFSGRLNCKHRENTSAVCFKMKSCPVCGSTSLYLPPLRLSLKKQPLVSLICLQSSHNSFSGDSLLSLVHLFMLTAVVWCF